MMHILGEPEISFSHGMQQESLNPGCPQSIKAFKSLTGLKLTNSGPWTGCKIESLIHHGRGEKKTFLQQVIILSKGWLFGTTQSFKISACKWNGQNAQ